MTGDDAEVEPPRSFVEPFLARERAAREVLDELSADLLVGEAEAVRERLRELAETDHGTFLTCCLCCNGNDQFFADAAEQIPTTGAPTDGHSSPAAVSIADTNAVAENGNSPSADSTQSIASSGGVPGTVSATVRRFSQARSPPSAE
jgi:hypothetical protein